MGAAKAKATQTSSGRRAQFSDLNTVSRRSLGFGSGEAKNHPAAIIQGPTRHWGDQLAADQSQADQAQADPLEVRIRLKSQGNTSMIGREH
jgi:hypothetical protein